MGVASWTVGVLHGAVNTALYRKPNSVAGQAFSRGPQCSDLSSG